MDGDFDSSLRWKDVEYLSLNLLTVEVPLLVPHFGSLPFYPRPVGHLGVQTCMNSGRKVTKNRDNPRSRILCPSSPTFEFIQRVCLDLRLGPKDSGLGPESA